MKKCSDSMVNRWLATGNDKNNRASNRPEEDAVQTLYTPDDLLIHSESDPRIGAPVWS